ncbi:aluminum-activated malate transporter 10-like [Zingiber officinale]|uniref:aluminum-activated malate transporter 10-like n=1 Tax=Zingiber officinale TaxID=94328 RepID=UPI001C4AA020|nr:aluminum-activated malate transporter 10-like [Zingiber officinale]
MAADQNQVLPESGGMARAWDRLVEFGVGMRSKVIVFAEKVWRMGADDPRKVIHAVKVGVALSLVSLFYYTRPFYDKFGSNTMWAVMTVVVVFEYTVGGCLYKVINRGIATLGGGSLALAAHWMADKSGPKTEPVILGASVFLLAIAATFFRFMPTVKARFDYGVTIFILTFSLVALSGYRVDDLADLTTERISTIGIGIAITVSVCIFIFPVWSGQELHFLISRNLAKLAESLEGGLEDYFPKNGDSIDRTESASKRSHRYKCVLDSKSSEDSLASLARWEPAHGWFKFRHPWQQYSKVGAAIRHCAYCVEAMHGCVNSETIKRSPECWDKHLRDACMKLNSDSSKVLKELSSSVKTTKKSPSVDLLVGEMKNSVEELQISLSSLAEASTQPRPAESSELENENSSDVDECDVAVVLMPLTEAMAVVTMASLLIEISARIEGVVEAVAALAELACFKPIGDDKSRSKVQAEEQEEMTDIPVQNNRNPNCANRNNNKDANPPPRVR